MISVIGCRICSTSEDEADAKAPTNEPNHPRMWLIKSVDGAHPRKACIICVRPSNRFATSSLPISCNSYRDNNWMGNWSSW